MAVVNEDRSVEDLAAIIVTLDGDGVLASTCLRCGLTGNIDPDMPLLAVIVADAHRHLQECTGTNKAPKVKLFEVGYAVDISGTLIDPRSGEG
jgi:hypothetical protein